MADPHVGFRVRTQIERPSRAVVEGLGALETTIITDAMHRFGGMDANIRPAGAGMRCAGPAITVRVAAGDNLMVYKAIELSQPGDILVIESHGFTSVSQWGDMLSMVALARKVGGAVMDGAMRDIPGICDVGFPVFAKPWSVPNGALKDGPGEVNYPVAVGNVPVLPGDIVIADANGVAVVPRADAEGVLETALKLAAAEAKRIKAIAAGDVIPDWLEDTLRQKGCRIE